MRLNVGDKVRFLNEKGEGVVSKILNKTTVAVTVEDDFEFPYLIAELVLITDTTKPIVIQKEEVRVAECIEVKIKKSDKQETKEIEGIYLAFSPEHINDIAHSSINVWFVNHTNYQVLFTYSLFQNGQYKTITHDKAKPNARLLIETIERSLLHDFSNFKIDVLFFDAEIHSYQQPVSEIVKLKPIKLYKENSFSSNSFISEKALVMKVAQLHEEEGGANLYDNTDLSKILFQKQYKATNQKISKPHFSNDPSREMEIDLHIEELIDDFKGMSNYEIVQLQLNRLHKAIDKAIKEHYRTLIVIHGVGNGRLKQEVCATLSTYDNVRFHDASYSKYGFGATEVVFS